MSYSRPLHSKHDYLIPAWLNSLVSRPHQQQSWAGSMPMHCGRQPGYYYHRRSDGLDGATLDRHGTEEMNLKGGR